MADDIALVADVPLNLLFRCRGGHAHEIVEGDKHNRAPIQAGEVFYLPADCAIGLLEQYGTARPTDASISPSGRSGLIPGLRRA